MFTATLATAREATPHPPCAVPDRHLRADDYYVADCADSYARALVEAYHYSHTASALHVYIHGLIEKRSHRCVGVVWWLPPSPSSAEKTLAWYGLPAYRKDRVLSLHRTVIAPGVPTNAASFLIGRSIRLIKREYAAKPLLQWVALNTYADEWQHHTGQIYKATNWDYRGLTDRALPVWVDCQGRTFSHKRGWNDLSPDQLRSMGMTLVGRFRKHVYTKRLTSC